MIPSIPEQLEAYQSDSRKMAAEDRARKDFFIHQKTEAKLRAAGKKQVKKAKRSLAVPRKSV